MLKYLADENISPETVIFLRAKGYNIVHVRDVGLKGKPDNLIVDFAIKENLVIITQDLDYGEIHFQSEINIPAVIILRLKSQWFETINKELLKLLNSGKLETEEFKDALVIVTEERYRVRKKSPQ